MKGQRLEFKSWKKCGYVACGQISHAVYEAWKWKNSSFADFSVQDDILVDPRISMLGRECWEVEGLSCLYKPPPKWLLLSHPPCLCFLLKVWQKPDTEWSVSRVQLPPLNFIHPDIQSHPQQNCASPSVLSLWVCRLSLWVPAHEAARRWKCARRVCLKLLSTSSVWLKESK